MLWPELPWRVIISSDLHVFFVGFTRGARMVRGDCRERSRHKLWPSRRSFCIQRHQETGTLKKNFDNFPWFYLRGTMNPLHHNISMHILQTFLCTFALMLIRRTSLTIESFLSWWWFLLFMWAQWSLLGWYCKGSMLVSMMHLCFKEIKWPQLQ